MSSSSAKIEKSKFNYNHGIVLLLLRTNSEIRIATSEFKQNTGSVVLSHDSSIVIVTSEFDNNTQAGFALLDQGMILGSKGGNIVINNSNFTNNNSPVIVAISTRIEHHNHLLVMNNSAENGFAIITLDHSELIGHRSGNVTISDNLRSLVAFNITFMGNVRFLSNYQPQTASMFQEGGALTLVQTNVYLEGISTFKYNHAENGAAIFSIESKFYIKGNVYVANNNANKMEEASTSWTVN